MFILNLILFLLVLTSIVSIHELGHYYFAKRAGVLCYEFSIGMGPALWKKKTGETQFSIRALPLGGYVAMSGEQADNQSVFIKHGMNVGLVLNDNNIVTHLAIEEGVDVNVFGKVVNFDLLGKDYTQLFIEVEDVDGITTKYEVARNAFYVDSKENVVQISPFERSLANKTKLERFMVLFAGPMMNVILAFLILFFVGFFVKMPVASSNVIAEVVEGGALVDFNDGDKIVKINETPVLNYYEIERALYSKEYPITVKSEITAGQKSTEVVLGVYLQQLGITNHKAEGGNLYEPVVGQAFGRAKSHLDAGDEILKIKIGDNEEVVNDWQDILDFVKANDGSTVSITYLRDGSEGVAKYDVISANAINKLGSLPIVIQLGFVKETEFNLMHSLKYPFVQMGSDISSMGTTLGLLFNPNEKIGIRDLSGPVGIFSLVSNAASQGIISLLTFTAFLSINIGLLNLLPIPALDGGQILFLGIEAVTKKKIPHKIANTINNVTFYLLLLLIIYVTFNDILRLF